MFWPHNRDSHNRMCAEIGGRDKWVAFKVHLRPCGFSGVLRVDLLTVNMLGIRRYGNCFIVLIFILWLAV